MEVEHPRLWHGHMGGVGTAQEAHVLPGSRQWVAASPVQGQEEAMVRPGSEPLPSRLQPAASKGG